MSRWASRARLGLLGNPENRRIRAFQETVEALGRPRPPCLSYTELLADPRAIERFRVERLRIDSPGENEEVARRLIELGGGPSRPLEHGEIAFHREAYRGFCRLLEWVEKSRIPCLNAPRDIAVMFDKWACHERFLRHGVPRPPAARELLPGGRVFLKPLHGSSASGVCAYRCSGHRRQLIAPLRIGAGCLLNSLQVQTYTRPADIDHILERLLPEGMICEQWIPKLTLPGGAIDLRVLVIGGVARHRVVRQSRHPMTNLHLGNRRGDLRELRSAIGREKLEAALRVAEQAAACFPDSLYAGVDVLLDTRHRAWVAEINAFGDLLPGLEHRGESAYTAIAKACA